MGFDVEDQTLTRLVRLAKAREEKIAVSDEAPVIFVIDTAKGQVVREVTLEGVPKAAQIARYLLVLRGKRASSRMARHRHRCAGRAPSAGVAAIMEHGLSTR